jgi:hypothetical protein
MKTIRRCAAMVIKNISKLIILSMLLPNINKPRNRDKSEMPEGLSFFTRSVSPDRVKEKPLCALCASVVKII